MKKALLIFLLSFLMWSIGNIYAQKKGADCGATCFHTEVIKAEENSSGCTDYELKITYDGRCAHALSHYSVAVPCGKVKNLSNSQNWKQVFGLDPKTGLYGFKIDDIPGFGETALTSFTVKFTLCTDNASCSEQLKCWQPVVAYKAGTCVNYDTLTSTACHALKAHLEKQDASCFGVADGSMTVVIEEGQQPYTFNWSTSATTATILNLSAGTYSVVVKDASGSEVTLSGEILQPSAIEIAGIPVQASCGGVPDGSIDITVSGGQGGYTYQWNNGATTEDLSALSAGNYTVTVKDSKGCSAQKAFTISNATQISIATTPTLPTCTQSNGALNITVTGGTPPYSYAWSNGATAEDLQNISAGLYKVVVTDANGCTGEMTYNLRENNTLRLSVTVTPTSCVDDASGAVNLTVTGGTAPYTFVWSNGATTEDLSALLAGLYTVTVTDANGCTATLRVSVSKRTLQVNTLITQPLCHGDSTGAITVNPYDGTEPYTYDWSNGQTGNSITGLPPGVYSVTITDSTGCTRKLLFVINDPPAITATASVTNAQCNAEGSYNIDLTVGGGKAPYQYEWSNGATTEDLDSVNTGTYTVIITDTNGCSYTKEVTVTGASMGWTCLITQPDSIPVCGSANNILATPVTGADSYTWSVAGTDGQWSITSGGSSGTITYTAGQANSSATFTLTLSKDGCTQTCSLTLATCASDTTGGGDPGNGGGGNGGGDPGSEACEECFSTSVVQTTDNGSCKTFEVTVNTNGNCHHDLSHWDIAIPCGNIKNYSNSEGWPMVIGKDPTTGLYGLKVDNIHGFGNSAASFTVKFTLCYDQACEDVLGDWDAVVAYKAGQCVGYDTTAIEHEGGSPEFALTAYPNPFTTQINFEWTADEDDEATLEILDQYGRTVTEIFRMNVSKGESYKYDWIQSGLKENLYIYRFRTSTRTVYGRLFKTK